VWIRVGTGEAKFTETPFYVCALAGTEGHWTTTGGSCLYSPTPTSFDVYVRRHDNAAIDPKDVEKWQWRIMWIGIQP
jgi:hypothetical protein